MVKALGRFVHKKGFDLLLSAAAAVAAQGAQFRLEIAGDGPERSTLEALAGELDISDRVVFRGWIDRVATFLADADLFVLPSRDEPFGIVLLEAMACGVPIIATRVSGPLEILDDGSALLVVPDDSQALASAMLSALGNEAAAAKRARTASAAYAAKYAEAVVIGRYVAAYRRLANAATVRRRILAAK